MVTGTGLRLETKVPVPLHVEQTGGACRRAAARAAGGSSKAGRKEGGVSGRASAVGVLDVDAFEAIPAAKTATTRPERPSKKGMDARRRWLP
jgi:hypothetical protein